MMSTITSYLYEQNLQVVTTDTAVSNIMSMFYTPNVKVYRGVDNDIRVNFVNRDQKKTSLIDKTASFIMIDPDTHMTLLEKSVTSIDATKGIAEINISETDLLNLTAKYYTYSFKIVDGEGKTQIGYSDDNYGAGGSLEVLDGVYPTFQESTVETFTEGDGGSIIYLKPHINKNVAVHSAVVYFSSAFTGTLTIQGSLSPQPTGLQNADFTTISVQTYTAQTANAFVSFTGVYSAVRFVRATTTGTLSQVLYRP